MKYSYHYNVCRHCKRFDAVWISELKPDFPMLFVRFIVPESDAAKFNIKLGRVQASPDDITVVQTLEGLVSFFNDNGPGTIRSETGKVIAFGDFFKLIEESNKHSKHSPEEIKEIFKSAFTTVIEGVSCTFVDETELLGD